MVGLIWFVQVVHYPLFARVPGTDDAGESRTRSCRGGVFWRVLKHGDVGRGAQGRASVRPGRGPRSPAPRRSGGEQRARASEGLARREVAADGPRIRRPGDVAADEEVLALPQAETAADAGRPTPITVVMTNRVGLNSHDTATIVLTETDPAKTGPAKIRGKVMMGPRAQPELQVYLIDVKGQLKDQVSTNKEGAFEFKNVEPGRYRVYSVKRGSQRRGFVDVTVLPNETKEVTINLSL